MGVVQRTLQGQLPFPVTEFGDAKEVVVERGHARELHMALSRAGIEAHVRSPNYGMIYEFVHEPGVLHLRATPTVALEEIEQALDAREVPYHRQPAQRRPLIAY